MNQRAAVALIAGEKSPFMGQLKIESARFDVMKPMDWAADRLGEWGVCAWLVPVTPTMPSGNKYHYAFILEPFHGRVVEGLKILHPTSPDFPSYPPAPP